MGEAIAFYVLGGLILVLGVLVVSARNTVYSVLFLVANFLCVAALYVLLHAEFLAVIQILTYAGGIVVLYLFVVMLVNLKSPETHQDANRHDLIGILMAGAVLVQFVAIGLYSFGREGVPSNAAAAAAGAALSGNVERIGHLLYVDYLVPFEVASVLLLVAMVGAIMLARKEL